VRGGHHGYCCAGVSYPQPSEQRETGLGAGAAAPQYSADGRWYWNGQRWLATTAPGPTWSRPYAPPDGRAAAAVAMVGLAAAAGLALLAGDGLDLVAAVVAPGSALEVVAAFIVALGLFANVAGTIGAAIAVPMWMHRCYRNLPALGATGLHWSPVWAAAAWFIPLADLVIPFLIVRELSTRSAGTAVTPSPLLYVWLPAWLAAGSLGLASSLAGLFGRLGTDALGALDGVAVAIAGAAFIWLLQQISRRQRGRYGELLAASGQTPPP
jgi:hypothetical protein